MWKKIRGFEYWINQKGDVKNKHGRILKPQLGRAKGK